jgi:cytochrome c oxidase subunit 2
MTYIIIALVIGILIFLANLIKVLELSSELRGESQSLINDKDNKSQGLLLFLFLFAFFGFILYQISTYSKFLLPDAASEHGESVDALMNFNLIIIGLVFVLTHVVLFWFAYKYHGKKGNKAEFFAHSNKLEFIWTSVPALFLAVIIIFGLNTWNKMTGPTPEGAVELELYAKQFDWTARYAGTDNVLGKSNYKLIEGSNVVGLDSTDNATWDDFTVKGDFVIPVGKNVAFSFRSRDVIHSAYMPHFRAQMNCVPGMVTSFHFKPTITTEEMRIKTGNKDFNYTLLCNKICGAAHYNMQMNIIVVSQEEYNKWAKEQKPLFAHLNQQKENKDVNKIASIN